MSNKEVTLTYHEDHTCRFYIDYFKDIGIEIKNTRKGTVVRAWFSPEEWAQIVALLAKVREEQADETMD